jgi:hypothetical protein
MFAIIIMPYFPSKFANFSMNLRIAIRDEGSGKHILLSSFFDLCRVENLDFLVPSAIVAFLNGADRVTIPKR